MGWKQPNKLNGWLEMKQKIDDGTKLEVCNLFINKKIKEVKIIDNCESFENYFLELLFDDNSKVLIKTEYTLKLGGL